MCLKSFADIGTFLAPIVALIIALISPLIQKHFGKTKLSLTMSNEFPDRTRTSVSIERENKKENVWAFFFRLNVHNDGSNDAEHVQVYISSLRKEKDLKDLNNFLPMYLKWSYRSNVENKIEIERLLKGTNRHCDLFFVPHDGSCLIFSVEENMNTNGKLNNAIYEPGIYYANILLACSNSKKKEFKIQINYKKTWDSMVIDNPEDFSEFVEVKLC